MTELSQAIKVLVVDDSALMRNLVGRIVEGASPDLAVAGTAMNGRFAFMKLDSLRPDIIVLDLEMPEMNGIEFLRERKNRGIEIPVIILSSIAQKGAAVTMDALALGASDFIMKPSGSISEDIHLIGAQLVEMIRHYGGRYRDTLRGSEAHAAQVQAASAEVRLAPRPVPVESPRDADAVPHYVPEGRPGPLEIIALGISTGGPNALRKVFAELDASIKVPMLVVQHMPAGFTTEFAKSLDRICPLEVKEAEEGDIIKPGRILIAPGDYHIRVEKKSLASVLHLESTAPVNGHRPSADVLFQSVGELFGNRAMGIIMTGMGKDGAHNIGLIYKAGGITLGQDEKSSVVYGMPRVAFEYGYLTRQVSLDNMAATIGEYVAQLAPSA